MAWSVYHTVIFGTGGVLLASNIQGIFTQLTQDNTEQAPTTHTCDTSLGTTTAQKLDIEQQCHDFIDTLPEGDDNTYVIKAAPRPS